MNTNQVILNLDDEQSFAQSVNPAKDATSVSVSQVSGQPQNDNVIKPVQQLANRLQSVNNSIVGFNRTFEHAENSAFRKTIERYINSWDQYIQAWQAEAIKHRDRRPQVQGDVFRIKISTDAIEMSFYHVPLEVINPWLYRELGEEKTQHTEMAGLIRYLFGGDAFEIKVWSTSPHTALSLRVDTKIDQNDIAVIGLLIQRWSGYKPDYSLFTEQSTSNLVSKASPIRPQATLRVHSRNKHQASGTHLLAFLSRAVAVSF